MSTPVVYNGTTYFIPSFGNGGYAQGAGNLSLYLVALASGSIQLSGGLFSLTGQLNFGPSFGLTALDFISHTTTPASAGVLRLAKTDTIDWRNNGNTGDNQLAVNGSDQLTYNGTVLQTGTGFVTSVSGTANQIASTGGATPVLSLTNPLITPGPATINGFLIANGTTNEFIKLQLSGVDAAAIAVDFTDTYFDIGGSTGRLIFRDVLTEVPFAFMTHTGGMQFGDTVNMSVHKIQNLLSGSVAGDAISFGQSGTTLAGLNVNAQKVTNMAQGTTAGDAVAFPVTGTQIDTSVALAGNPTTTTPAAGNSSTQIATTAFVDPARSLATSGYQKLSSGLVVQWGQQSVATATAITFPVAFSTAAFMVVTNVFSGFPISAVTSWTALSTTGFTAVVNNFAGSGITATVGWIAIGH